VRVSTLGTVVAGSELRHDYGHGQETLLLTHGFVDGIPADSPMAEKVRMVVEEAEKAEKPATSQDVYDRQSTEV